MKRHSERARGKPDSRRGFTLVEVMLVVLIIGVALTVAVPEMTKSIRGNKLRTAASSIVKAGKYARSMAILSQQPVRLTFHKADGRVEAGGPPKVNLNRTLEGVLIVNFEAEGAILSSEDETITVHYQRNGRCTPYSVTLADSKDRTLTVEIAAFAGAKTKGRD